MARDLARAADVDAFLPRYSALMVEIYPGYVDEAATMALVTAALEPLSLPERAACAQALASVPPQRIRDALRAAQN